MKQLSQPFALIKKSFEIFFEKENLSSLFKIYAWLLPFQAFFLYQNYFVATQSKALNISDSTVILSKYPVFLTAIIVVNILFLLVSLWVELAGIKALNTIYAGQTIKIKEIYGYTLKNLWPFLLLSALIPLLIGFGLLLLIIPGIIFSVWYAFSKFIFVAENKGVIESFKASRSLVKGKFWPVFGRLIVFMVFGLVFQLLFALVPFGIGSALAPLFGALLILPSLLLYKEVID